MSQENIGLDHKLNHDQQLLCIIGKGSFGAILLSRSLYNTETLAIKFMPKNKLTIDKHPCYPTDTEDYLERIQKDSPIIDNSLDETHLLTDIYIQTKKINVEMFENEKMMNKNIDLMSSHAFDSLITKESFFTNYIKNEIKRELPMLGIHTKNTYLEKDLKITIFTADLEKTKEEYSQLKKKCAVPVSDKEVRQLTYKLIASPQWNIPDFKVPQAPKIPGLNIPDFKVPQIPGYQIPGLNSLSSELMLAHNLALEL
uniref:CSON014308 protein n=1 Tax=Culicoides sonorensis TaxID=179676 RepID=A0A336K600_CULSO